MVNKIKELFKKVFTFKNVFSCFISAIGYGFGYYIPHNMGFNSVISLICCILVGLVFDFIAEKIMNTDIFKNDKMPRLKLGIVVYFIYLIFWFISYITMGHDLDSDLFLALKYMIAIQAGGFVLNMIITFIKRKINKN